MEYNPGHSRFGFISGVLVAVFLHSDQCAAVKFERDRVVGAAARRARHQQQAAAASSDDPDDDDHDTYVSKGGGETMSNRERAKANTQWNVEKLNKVWPNPTEYDPNEYPIPNTKVCNEQDLKIFHHFARKLQHGRSPWSMHLVGVCLWKHMDYTTGNKEDLFPHVYQECLEAEFCRTFADWYANGELPTPQSRERRCVSHDCAGGIAGLAVYGLYHMNHTCRKACRKRKWADLGWTENCGLVCRACTEDMDAHLKVMLGENGMMICDVDYEEPEWDHIGYYCYGTRCTDPGSKEYDNGEKNSSNASVEAGMSPAAQGLVSDIWGLVLDGPLNSLADKAEAAGRFSWDDILDIGEPEMPSPPPNVAAVVSSSGDGTTPAAVRTGDDIGKAATEPQHAPSADANASVFWGDLFDEIEEHA